MKASGPVTGLVVALESAACTRREVQAPVPQDTHAVPARQTPATPPAPREALFAERSDERARLVRRVAEGGVTDPRVLAAMGRVPRHHFVPEAVRSEAYLDQPLPIGWGQTISQPYVVAAMTAAVAPTPADRCLEIGTGSGYQAAVLAELCARTYSIEYIPELAAFGARNLRALGYPVEVRTGDGYLGWPEAAPFNVIVVTAAPERVPQPLLDQLALGGRLIIPVGPAGSTQRLELWTRRAPGSDPEAFQRRALEAVRFVPFLGDGGGG